MSLNPSNLNPLSNEAKDRQMGSPQSHQGNTQTATTLPAPSDQRPTMHTAPLRAQTQPPHGRDLPREGVRTHVSSDSVQARRKARRDAQVTSQRHHFSSEAWLVREALKDCSVRYAAGWHAANSPIRKAIASRVFAIVYAAAAHQVRRLVRQQILLSGADARHYGRHHLRYCASTCRLLIAFLAPAQTGQSTDQRLAG